MVHLFAVQTTNKEEYEIIDKLKKLHEEFRNEAIVFSGHGHTNGGAWNTAKTIKRILSESKYAYILTEEKEKEIEQCL